MIFIAAILFAAVPHTDNLWAQSAFIAFGTLCAGMFVRGLIQQSLDGNFDNLKKIYNKVDRLPK